MTKSLASCERKFARYFRGAQAARLLVRRLAARTFDLCNLGAENVTAQKVRDGEAAIASTRAACAPQISSLCVV